MDLKVIEQLFEDWSGDKIVEIEHIEQAGSDRQYVRIKSNNSLSVLGAYNPVVKENEAYFNFTKHFKTYRINVPKIYKISADRCYYLVEDLGNESLYKKVIACNGNITKEVVQLYKKSLKALIKMQVSAGKSIDYSYCYPTHKFDSTTIKWDLNYFKYNYLKLAGIIFDENRLEHDFETLTRYLLNTPCSYFMFRDFQSRNIIIKNGEPWFIDFQGARQGPLAYDVASLLYQAKARIPYELRKELVEYYFSQLNKVLTIDYDSLVKQFRAFALLRTLQVLGAYGFRGYFEKKPHFIDSIPYALDNLNFLLNKRDWIPVTLPHLTEIMLKQATVPKTKVYNGLTVTVTSFSYRKGIPTDTWGNGGGFVFDCRAINNPGRYTAFQSQNGNDPEVIEFFKTQSNIDLFLQNVINVVEPSIITYNERGFNNLMINFGCTGGQHRSVYCAQNFAKFLTDKFDINVILWHREQNILQEYVKKM